jgi:unsaturated rhamnogalacturonyl hydrolase
MVDIIDACDGVCVQNSYENYVNYTKVLNAKEAVGSVLWASVIMEKPMA